MLFFTSVVTAQKIAAGAANRAVGATELETLGDLDWQDYCKTVTDLTGVKDIGFPTIGLLSASKVVDFEQNLINKG